METDNTANADVYQEVTNVASEESRAIQAEISRLEAQVEILQARDVSLLALVRTLRELLPAPHADATPYTPIYSLADSVALTGRAVRTP